MMPLEVSNHHFLLLLRFESGHWQLGDVGRIYCRNGKTLLGGDRQIGFPPKTEANHELEKWKEKQKGKIKIETQTNKETTCSFISDGIFGFRFDFCTNTTGGQHDRHCSIDYDWQFWHDENAKRKEMEKGWKMKKISRRGRAVEKVGELKRKRTRKIETMTTRPWANNASSNNNIQFQFPPGVVVF